VKRILLVIDNLEFGGGERGFLQLASRLRNRFKLFVAAMPGGTFQQAVEDLGIVFIPVDVSRRISLKPIRQIRNLVKSNMVDIIHSQGARADFFARIAGRIANVPHILSTTQMPIEGFDVGILRKKIYLFMDRLSGLFVERFIVVSEALQVLLTQGRGVPAQRVVRIYNGIEVDLYQPHLKHTDLRNEWGIPSTIPLIGAVGRLVWQKGFEFFIKAIPEILLTSPEAKFLIVGEGPLRSQLEKLAQRLNIYDNLIFTGFQNDIQHILSSIDVLMVPSLLEGLPMIILEGMAMAKPIVATNIDGITEQISHEREGILVPIRKPEALAGAVSRIIEDDELATALGKAARKRVESSFSVGKMVRETEKVYLSLLSDK
jgi:glycosyltransferase involved in cell wall biosynthesis